MKNLKVLNKKQILQLLAAQSCKLATRMIIWYGLSICFARFGFNNNIVSDIALKILAWRLSLLAYSSIREVAQQRDDGKEVVWDILLCGMELINRKINERESDSQ